MPGTNGRGSPVVYINARIIDPASGTDIKGALVTEGGLIRDFGPALFKDALNREFAACPVDVDDL